MKLFSKSCVICIGALVAGCATEIRYVDRPVLPEDAWIVDCMVAPPPSVLVSRQSSEEKKLILMTDAYNGQTSNVLDCNNRWKSLREWKQKQIELRALKEEKE